MTLPCMSNSMTGSRRPNAASCRRQSGQPVSSDHRRRRGDAESAVEVWDMQDFIGTARPRLMRCASHYGESADRSTAAGARVSSGEARMCLHVPEPDTPATPALGDAEPGRCRPRDLGIQRLVVAGHPGRREPLLEPRPNGAAIEPIDLLHRARSLLDAVDDETRHTVLDDLRHRAAWERNDGRAAGHRLNDDEPEGLRPVDRKEQRARIAEECALLSLPDLADELDERMIEQRADALLEVLPVGVVDLGRDLERQPCETGDLDRPVGPLLGRDPPEECEIVAPR